MTIYLPYPDFMRSAKCLSDKHLDAQRSTVRELIKQITILHRDSPWERHITQVLWICEATLRERRRRGRTERGVTPWMLDKQTPPPEWLNAQYHANDRAMLLDDDPEHYGRMGWNA